jgi:hypothetical protein
MNVQKIRLLSLTIDHFKNVDFGTIEFAASKPFFANPIDMEFNPDVIGLYGQNGTGKTTVIQAVSLFQALASKAKLPEHAFECISAWSDQATLSIELGIWTDQSVIWVKLDIVLARQVGTQTAMLAKEVLSYKMYDPKKKTWSAKIDAITLDYLTAELASFVRPHTRMAVIKQNRKDHVIQLNVLKQLAINDRTSALFDDRLLAILGAISQPLFQTTTMLIREITRYATRNLMMIHNRDLTKIAAKDELPLRVWMEDEAGMLFQGSGHLNLAGASAYPQAEYQSLLRMIDQVNLLMPSFIPGMKLEVVVLGDELSSQGERQSVVEIVTVLRDRKIPLRYESEGIKKMISINSALIAVYNDPSFCLFIDELDASVFEYLFGQLIKILGEGAKGQLFFTSHNLRPLELLPYEDIYLSTTNPANRYIKLKHVKTTHNVRDFYLRGLQLGGQDEQIYHLTNSDQIRRAFRAAGDVKHRGE